MSDAFAALESRRYAAARTAFNAVLALDPGNGVAAGGLEQIRQETELRRIDSVEQQAAAAASEERWEDALAHYQSALKIDPNIKFARDGQQLAQAQLRTDSVLSRILANPDKLSNAKLLADGQRIVAEAKTLPQTGPKLQRKISEVETLLQRYSEPVEVELRSDSRTSVLLSSVGELGTFSNKTVTLRPGAYTLVGSRDGCRDVRQQVIVRAGMDPIDIRCTDEL